MKRAILIVGVFVCIAVLFGTIKAEAKMAKGIKRAIRVYCLTHKTDPDCKAIKEKKWQLSRVLAKMRKDRVDICKKYPDEPFCKDIKQLREIKKEINGHLKAIRQRIKENDLKNQSSPLSVIKTNKN